MAKETYLPGIILLVMGLVFIYNNKSMAKGAAKFYQRLYTEKNLGVIFRIIGVILVLGGFIIAFFN